MTRRSVVIGAGADVLVDADALAAELAGPTPPVLLDVRWAPVSYTHLTLPTILLV